MWKIRLKTAGNLIVILVSVLLQLWIYRFIYQESKENRMTFMVIGNWVISEKACLAIYILSAVFLYIRIYTGPEKEMFRRALLAGAGPIGLLAFRQIERLELGFDHYNSIGLWEEYLYNSIEVYARSYAENRAEEYCRYLSE